MKSFRYRPERCNPPSNVANSFNGIRIKPGINNLSDEVAKLLTEHPDYQRYVKWGAIETVDSPPEVKQNAEINHGPETLGSLGEDEIEVLIDRTSSVATLEQWLASENRATVKTKLRNKIKELKA